MSMRGTQGIIWARERIARIRGAVCARRAQQGQSLVELTLLLPLFMLLLLAAGEFGLALREQMSLDQATQQAARYLAEHPAISGCPSGAQGWTLSLPCDQLLANPAYSGTFTCSREFSETSPIAIEVGCTDGSIPTSCAQQFAWLHGHLPLSSVPALDQPTGYDQRSRPAAQQETVYGECSSYIVMSYLQEHGFNTQGMFVYVDFSTNSLNELQDTITVTYPYQIVLPIADQINLCRASNPYGVTYPTGSLCLGARVSTVAAVEAPSGITVSKGADGTYNQAVISWTPPYNPDPDPYPAGVALQYNVYSHPCECAADLTATPNTVVVNSSTPTKVTVTDSCYPVACDPLRYYYEVTAVQPEPGGPAGVGLESPRAGAAGPPP